MKIFTYTQLCRFWQRHANAKRPLLAWYREVESANWDRPKDITSRYPGASILPNRRAVFRIKGNGYRMIVDVNYKTQSVFIRFLGTHAEYDRINALEV